MTPSNLPAMPTFGVTVLLVDDQPIIAEAVRHMLEDQKDIAFHYCSDPSKAIQMALDLKPTVILQDLVMPDIDGLLLVRYMRSNPETSQIPLIVLSTKEEPKIKAEAFALGANDYMVKLPDKIELIARIRYHSAGYIRLLERNEAYAKLEENQRILNAELKEAAAYVTSLLPPPLEDKEFQASWKFIPSTQLGGDAFGYHWLDDAHFCIYLLDVCGHGVGAAVLSISVMNVLRAQSLPNADFHRPETVLEALNETFPMELHNNMYFTMWYGVFNKNTHELVYASGGHPPAVLIQEATVEQLKTPGFIIGGMPGTSFQTQKIKVAKKATLFIYSDGVYEIERGDGTVYPLDDFIKTLQESSTAKGENLEFILNHARQLNGPGPFADDFSIMQLDFT